MKIIRVFPQRTSYTPDDDYVFIGEPPGMFIPEHDEIHISCTFTWDIPYCEHLKYQWEPYTEKPVRVGGVAYGSPCDTFTAGLYVKQGITFTSRGCNNLCRWCAVPNKEGRIKELPIVAGNIIQDNNFLQTSKEHKEKVFEMLKSQKGICFKGGLQANLVDDHFINGISELSIKELWLACDTDSSFTAFEKACKKLIDAGYTRNHIRCYALIGQEENINQAEDRLMAIYEVGALPFSQLFQPIVGERIKYNDEWKAFNRKWSRPAIYKSEMEHCHT